MPRFPFFSVHGRRFEFLRETVLDFVLLKFIVLKKHTVSSFYIVLRIFTLSAYVISLFAFRYFRFLLFSLSCVYFFAFAFKTEFQ